MKEQVQQTRKEMIAELMTFFDECAKEYEWGEQRTESYRVFALSLYADFKDSDLLSELEWRRKAKEQGK